METTTPTSIAPGIIYALGTIAVWAAFFLILKVANALGAIIAKTPDSDPSRTRIRIATQAVSGIILFLLGVKTTHAFEKEGFKFPLTWFVMPWTAWVATFALIFAIVRLAQALTGITAAEKASAWKSCIIGVIIAVGMVYLYRLDEANKITILSGGIPMSLGKLLFFLTLAVLAVQGMALTANSAKARGWGKIIVTQLTLIAGSVIFGIPFVFLLVTSFKEDIDMSSKNGIVWIPKVTDTVQYFNEDPSKKHYDVEFNGRTVEALVMKEVNGQYQMDTFKPMSIRGTTFLVDKDKVKEVPVNAKVYTTEFNGKEITGFERENLEDGRKILRIMSPADQKGKEITVLPDKVIPVRHVGLRVQNYPEALDYMPPETYTGLVYLKNTLILVILGVIGTITGSSVVAYGFSRMKFPGREKLFTILLATMMLPGAVTLLPQFLIFRTLGWIDTLYPLWVPAFFGSAFNIFLLRQFFSQIPMELEDAAKIDGCSYFRTFSEIMIPQIKPALAVIAIWTFLGAWNNFMGPLIYINSPENMPLSYALQLFKGDRSNEPGLLMAFTSLTCIPVIALFFAAQKYFIEGVTLSGLGGR